MTPSQDNAIIRRLTLRARMVRLIREFFIDNGYLEVETPVRIPAPAPETHIDAQPSGSWYLQPSPELCMKRLLAAGFERIFQICKCFRKGERGQRHLPEMTMLEWYTADSDYRHMMAQCRQMIITVAQQLASNPFSYQGKIIDIWGAWETLTVEAAFERHGTISMSEALRQDRFDEIMGLEIEPHLGWHTPLFLVDYPVQCGALARINPTHKDVVERFELYIAGIELCNGFSELDDSTEQRRRFEAERAERRAAGKPCYPMPERFLEALPSMGPASGNALGIDRLAMLFTDSSDIDKVVAFVPEAL